MRGLFLHIVTFSLVNGTLILPSVPPRGFNTFNNYYFGSLNTSSLTDLVRALSSSPLSSAGFTTFFLDGGWSISTGVFPNGTAFTKQNLDAFGRPVPAPERYPGGLSGVAAVARSLGLGFGLWHIRGVHVDAVAAKLPVKGMPQFTLDQLVDDFPISGGKNGSCLWAPEWLGVNPLHPAAGAYYASVVEALVEQGATAIKGDCFMCWPCYTGEMSLLSAAVKASPASILLYLSPGGGNTVTNGSWVAANQIASFYRTITDFDAGNWYDWGVRFEASHPCAPKTSPPNKQTLTLHPLIYQIRVFNRRCSSPVIFLRRGSRGGKTARSRTST
jgi:hypothetical protein